MGTTVTIDEAALEAVRSPRRAEQRCLGEVVSDLARKGLPPEPRLPFRSGFPVFEVSPGAPPITPERVRELLGESA